MKTKHHHARRNADPETTAAYPSNRMEGYFESYAEIEIPETPAERHAAYSDAVMAAVLTLKAKLRSRDAKESLVAATAILSLESTRIRHGGEVSSCRAEPVTYEEVLEELNPSLKKKHSDCGKTTNPTSPSHAPTEQEALEHHTGEVWSAAVGQDALEPEEGRPEFTMEHAERIVKGYLKKWNMKANDITLGDFTLELGNRARGKVQQPA